MTVRAGCAMSACSPLPLSIKPLAHWLSVGGAGVSLWKESTSPAPRLPASKIKQTFLSTNLPFYWLLSSDQPDPTLGNITTWCYFPISIQLCSSHLLCAIIDKYITFLHVISPQIKLIIFIQLLFKISWDKRRNMHACCFFYNYKITFIRGL